MKNNYGEEIMILTKKNDIYVYFEVIRQLEPNSILDIGMFLKRIGNVSRQVMDEYAVPEEVILDGVDFWPELDFPIWKIVYDNVLKKDAWLEKGLAEGYDLAIMLGTKELKKKTDLRILIRWMEENTRYALVDEIGVEWENKYLIKKVIPLKVENDGYYLIDFGE